VLLGVAVLATGAGMRWGFGVDGRAGDEPVVPPGFVMAVEGDAGAGPVREGAVAADAVGGMGVPGGGRLSDPQR
jgi:hypothetical protein